MNVSPVFVPIKWLAQIFTEPDGNGGKASFSRVAGAFIIWKIVHMADLGKAIPDAMMTMFWVLIGYSFLSKALNGLNPAFSDVARAMAQSKLGIAAPKA